MVLMYCILWHQWFIYLFNYIAQKKKLNEQKVDLMPWGIIAISSILCANFVSVVCRTVASEKKVG